MQCQIDLAWSRGLAMVKNVFFEVFNTKGVCLKKHEEVAPDVLIVALHRVVLRFLFVVWGGGPQ